MLLQHNNIVVTFFFVLCCVAASLQYTTHLTKPLNTLPTNNKNNNKNNNNLLQPQPQPHTQQQQQQPQQLSLQFGDNISPVVVSFITSLLNNASTTTQNLLVKVFPPHIPVPVDSSHTSSGNYIFSFGNTKTRDVLITQADLNVVGSEGYIIRTATIQNVTYFIGDGNPPIPDIFSLHVSIGSHYAVFRMVEILGFSYFHPLKMTTPPNIDFLKISNMLNVTEKPYWSVRGLHHHTMHLLELTELLNGFGPNGPTDDIGWHSMLPYYQSFLFWLLANHQNRVEWVLLWAEDWALFANSTLRHSRLSTLIDMAHQLGIAAGADVPIAEEQQHAWRLIEQFGSIELETAQIHSKLDYLMSAGYDFISSENGYSEFTHPDDERMVAWMNITTAYAQDKYGKKTYIKCHCSVGQVAKDYKDPWTGKPLNFNFLPIMADPRLGIYPHTVQFYRFDDPAPTYGNTNFTYMFDFLTREIGQREVVYHGETAYWVNFDDDVPLFLPLYADARLYDLRMIAAYEIKSGKKMQGQFNFDSGWEWGYWLQSVITARAVWNPLMTIPTQSQALATSLSVITNIFGAASQDVLNLLVRTITAQRTYLIMGLINGTAPADIIGFNGQAYIEGWDTWAEIGALDVDASTQPLKYSFVDVRDPLHNDRYWDHVGPLLTEMDIEFNNITNQFQILAVSGKIPTWTLDLYNDIVDAALMTSLRTTQVHALYDYAAGFLRKSQSWRLARLKVAQSALSQAQVVVTRRESQYRIPREIIGGWRPWNPTCYDYGYLWTVHSLYYFWRDYEKAIASDISTALIPCYMNIINPINVAFGEGIYLNVTKIAWELFEKFKFKDFADCLEAPTSEPHYPLNATSKYNV